MAEVFGWDLDICVEPASYGVVIAYTDDPNQKGDEPSPHLCAYWDPESSTWEYEAYRPGHDWMKNSPTPLPEHQPLVDAVRKYLREN